MILQRLENFNIFVGEKKKNLKENNVDIKISYEVKYHVNHINLNSITSEKFLIDIMSFLFLLASYFFCNMYQSLGKFNK